MPRRFVDLSVPLETGIAPDPPMALPQIEYFGHDQTAEQRPRVGQLLEVAQVHRAGDLLFGGYDRRTETVELAHYLQDV